ncbi:MAG: flagellar hook-length control protein FliK [Pseudomonadota bacterium]
MSEGLDPSEGAVDFQALIAAPGTDAEKVKTVDVTLAAMLQPEEPPTPSGTPTTTDPVPLDVSRNGNVTQTAMFPWENDGNIGNAALDAWPIPAQTRIPPGMDTGVLPISDDGLLSRQRSGTATVETTKILLQETRPAAVPTSSDAVPAAGVQPSASNLDGRSPSFTVGAEPTRVSFTPDATIPKLSDGQVALAGDPRFVAAGQVAAEDSGRLAAREAGPSPFPATGLTSSSTTPSTEVGGISAASPGGEQVSPMDVPRAARYDARPDAGSVERASEPAIGPTKASAKSDGGLATSVTSRESAQAKTLVEASPSEQVKSDLPRSAGQTVPTATEATAPPPLDRAGPAPAATAAPVADVGGSAVQSVEAEFRPLSSEPEAPLRDQRVEAAQQRSDTMPARTEPKVVTQQIAQAFARSPDRPVEITLEPAELGKLQMTLSADKESVGVVIFAERSETLDLLRRHAGLLERDFRDLGYSEVALQFGAAGGNGADGSRDETLAPQVFPDVRSDAIEDEASGALLMSVVTPGLSPDQRLNIRL